MRVFLIDGTWELFRHFHAVPRARRTAGREVGAVRGVIGALVSLLEQGESHVGVATDHVIESFRNDLWPDYKTAAGVDPALLAQFDLLEEALAALGVAVWPMTDLEADDALASAARLAAADPDVERVFICSPDKDLAQCVKGKRVIQFDRRTAESRDAGGVRKKFGVPPHVIPDWLALVGDREDGYPGLEGWGAKTAAALLARYESIDAIPADVDDWDVEVRGAAQLAERLAGPNGRVLARHFRELATLRDDLPLFESVDDLAWRGPRPEFFDVCERLGAGAACRRAKALAHERLPAWHAVGDADLGRG